MVPGQGSRQATRGGRPPGDSPAVAEKASARAGALFRVSSSWWAPWALLASGAGGWLAVAGVEHAQSWLGIVPPAAFLTVLLAHPGLRARCAAGVAMLGEAGRIRAAWEAHVTEDLMPELTYRRGRRTVRLPRIVSVSGSPGAPILTVESLPWRDRKRRWEEAAPGLGKALGLPDPEISVDSEHVIMSFGGDAAGGLAPWRDSFPKPFPTDLERVPIARDCAGRPVHLGVLYNHTFVFGATGSGKGSVLWSIIAALAVGVPDGRVQLWGMDPKGGMEFVYGEHLFHRMGDGSPSQLRDMLRDLVGQMRERSDRLKNARIRKFTPSPGDPMVVLIIDEYLSLIMLQENAKDKAEVSNLLLELLSKGRAIGYVVIGAAQLAQKEYLRALREMFTQVVCLRTTSSTQSMMSLEDALEHGAVPHRIPLRGAQGTGYVKVGSDVPVKVRFAQWTDADIEAMDEWVKANRRPLVDVQDDLPEQVRPVVEGEWTDSTSAAGLPPGPGIHLGPGPERAASMAASAVVASEVVRPSSKSEAVRAYLDGLPADSPLPSVRSLAEATGVSVGLASKALAVFKQDRSLGMFTGSPSRGEAPEGDPTEHVKSTSSVPTSDLVTAGEHGDPLAEPAGVVFGSLP